MQKAKKRNLMHIEQLKLKNYRNYDQLDISFNNKVNVIIGENAQGKTNLMEAIYVLAFTRSYRTPRERELIQWEKEYAKIRSEEHTSELQSRGHLVCRLLLEKKNKYNNT